MNKYFTVCMVLAAFAVTSVASAETVRVSYDYAATGPGTGSGLWSVTIDSGLIPHEAAGNLVTFISAMREPTFTQRDALLPGDVMPATPGLVGWSSDDDNGQTEGGMAWEFYDAGEIVTLFSVTNGYRDYTWDIETTLAGAKDDSDLPAQNSYYWRADLADNPAGVDIFDDKNLQAASYWGDIATGDGHRHSGSSTKFEAGQDAYTDGAGNWPNSGGLDADADGDGVNVMLYMRRMRGFDDDGSVFFSNVRFGGDVFANTGTIPEPATIALLGLGFAALRRRKRS